MSGTLHDCIQNVVLKLVYDIAYGPALLKLTEKGVIFAPLGRKLDFLKAPIFWKVLKQPWNHHKVTLFKK